MFWTSDRWKALWKDATLPRHSRDTEEFYRSFASEINVMLAPLKRDSVLEIGCGNGALFPFLLIRDAGRYKGVDVSESMIADFRRKHPSLDLVAASGESYCDDAKYDLVLSVGVVQHFSAAMLSEHIANARAMLAPGGHILCAQIPWRALRYWYGHGELVGAPRPGILRYVKTRIAMNRHGMMGRWYDHREFVELAAKHGMKARFFGSLHYPYRFHVLLGPN